MNTQTPNKKASKMHVFLYVLIVILVLGLIARPGEPIIIEKAPLVSISGLYPLDILSSGESTLLDGFPYVQYGSSVTLTFQAPDDLVIWPDQIEVSGVTSYTFEVCESDLTLMYIHLEQVTGPVSVSFNTTRTHMYLTGTWKLNDNLIVYSQDGVSFDVYSNRFACNGLLEFLNDEIVFYEGPSFVDMNYIYDSGGLHYLDFDFEVIGPAMVPIVFYEWLCANATQIS